VYILMIMKLYTKSLPFWIFFVTVLLFQAGCSTQAPRPTGSIEGDISSVARSAMDENVERSSEAVHSYLVGRISYLDEDYEQALSGYQRANELIESSEPQIHSTLAELYIRKGDLGSAEGELKKLVTLDPTNLSYKMLYAGVLESLNDTAAAEQIYRKLLEEDPPVVEAYLLLASLLAREKGIEQGVGVLDLLIEKEPKHIMAHFYQGRFHETLGRHQLAYKHLRKAHDLSDDPEAFVPDIIRVLLKAEKQEEMEAFCKKLLEQDPNHSLARRVLGELAIGDRRYDEALQHLEVATESEEDAASIRFRIAMIQLEKRDLKAAERELTLILVNNPEHVEARYYLASIYAGTKRVSQAIDELRMISADGELFLRSQNFLAYLLRQEGETEQAVEAIELILAKDPENVRARLYLAYLLRELGQFSRAESILENLLNEDPINERALFQYAIVLYDLEKREESLAAMERLLEINPTQSDALNFVAYELAVSGGDLERAERLSRKSVKIRPEDGYYLDTLGWILFLRDDLIESEALLRRAAELTENDVVVTFHLLQVLMANQKQAEALTLANTVLEKTKPEDLEDPESKESYRGIKELVQSLRQ